MTYFSSLKMPHKKTTIFIADDHPMFREGIGSLLANQEDFELIGEATSGKKALQWLQHHQATIVITDIEMPDMNGLELSRELKKKYPEVKILVMSIHSDRNTLLRLLQCGVDGFLPKISKGTEVLEALHTIKKGKLFFPETIKNVVFSKAENRKSSYTRFNITEREYEVLQLIAASYTSPEIADTLCISEHTVQSHRKSLLQKLGIRNTAGLIKFAVQSGLVT